MILLKYKCTCPTFFDALPYQSGTHIFDEQLYKDRSVIEHSNVWIDGFKALLVRFEFSVINWLQVQIGA